METTNMQMSEVMPGTSVAGQTPTEPAVPTLADVIGAGEGGDQQPQNTAPVAEQTELKEPGYVQGRIQKAVEKVRAELRAEYEAQLAPLREAQMQREADELVSSGKITDREMALEYVRNRSGQPAKAEPQPARPRDAQGRFTSNPVTPATDIPDELRQRASELFAQAKTLQKFSGVDVLDLYRANPEYAEKVNSGEWDMADVLRAHGGAPEPAQASPAPVRSANGSGIGSASFATMAADQFKKVNEMLSRGGKIDMR